MQPSTEKLANKQTADWKTAKQQAGEVYVSMSMFSSSISCIATVELVKGLCRYTVEKLTREDTKKCPCQIKRLEDTPGVISSL